MGSALYAVAGVSTRDAWAVGQDGRIMHWDGRTWSDFDTPTTIDLNAVSMVSASDGWIVGGAIGGANSVVLRWDGNRWSEVSSPITSRPAAVAMVSATEGWAVGDHGAIWRYGTLLPTATPPTATPTAAPPANTPPVGPAPGESGAAPSSGGLWPAAGWGIGLVGGAIIIWLLARRGSRHTSQPS